MSAIEHHFECMVGSQTGVPMALTYDAPDVGIIVAGYEVWPVERSLLAEALVFPVLHDGWGVIEIHVIDDLVVVDIGAELPIHLVAELAEIETFLNLTYAADPEPVDPAELSVALVGAL